MNSVSIIICFYNAEKKLPATLEHILKLDLKNVRAELILVNNNSNDGSVNAIETILNTTKVLPWKIVFEPQPGLANARLCGIANAQNDFLLFCDDDNWLSPDYVMKSLSIFNQDASIAVLGGCGVPVSDVAIPSWFDEFQNNYAVGPQWPDSGEVKIKRNMVYGAGMVVRKSSFDVISSKGFRFFASGRTGKLLTSGEDSELCLAFRIAGYKIWYDKELFFQHYIEPNRLTDVYLQALLTGLNSSNFIGRFYREYLFGYRPKVGNLFWLKESIYLLRSICLEMFKGEVKGYNRSVKQLQYILRERFHYNNQVKEIIKICDELSKREFHF